MDNLGKFRESQNIHKSLYTGDFQTLMEITKVSDLSMRIAMNDVATDLAIEATDSVIVNLAYYS